MKSHSRLILITSLVIFMRVMAETPSAVSAELEDIQTLTAQEIENQAEAKAKQAALKEKLANETAQAYELQRKKEYEARKASLQAEKLAAKAEKTEKAARDARRSADGKTGKNKARAEQIAEQKESQYEVAAQTAREAQRTAAGLNNAAQLAARDTQNKIDELYRGETPLEKPPFTSTPAGQPLSSLPRSDDLEIVPYPGRSPSSGAAGNVRNGGKKRHAGIDENGETSRFSGKYPGRVIKAVNDPELGGWVLIEFRTPEGVRYSQTTMHLQQVLVRKGQELQPGAIIGTGQGKGSMFNPSLGRVPPTPHVHSEFRRDDRLIEPYSGSKLDYNPVSEKNERTKVANEAKKISDTAKSSKTILEFRGVKNNPTGPGYFAIAHPQDNGSITYYDIGGCLENGQPISRSEPSSQLPNLQNENVVRFKITEKQERRVNLILKNWNSNSGDCSRLLNDVAGAVGLDRSNSGFTAPSGVISELKRNNPSDSTLRSAVKDDVHTQTARQRSGREMRQIRERHEALAREGSDRGRGDSTGTPGRPSETSECGPYVVDCKMSGGSRR